MATVPVTAALFTRDTPFLDVRAEVEFARGAFPTATNLPILNDSEREQVGISYREDGPDAAEALGHRLVSGDLKRGRVRAWAEFISANPNAHLYCFRGGQRSRIAAQWLADEGIEVPRIEGGYKAMRRLLVDSFDALPTIVLIAGKTGTGKTRVLTKLPADATVDLEARANHRGSAFGKRFTPQPAQIDFENRIAIDFLKAGSTVFLEDESRTIGKAHLPLPLQEAMKAAPVLLLEDSMTNRVERIREEYVDDALAELSCIEGDRATAEQALRARLLESLDAITRRLGGVRHAEIRELLEDAFESGEPAAHAAWIERLLVDYYDPMYGYQIEKKRERIVATGDAEHLVEHATRLQEGAS